ncbi:MAG: putative toxin-antitoxin system toxin component, PIN family [Burkholderiales bacterium]|nr:putative toxin-antitoxin system toxin component, PIN family [Phycisphaerae bacterium]
MPLSVVFDCNIYLQALANPVGPAGQCVALAIDKSLLLFISPYVLQEIREVATRPKLIAKLHLRPDRVQALLDNIPKFAVCIAAVPVTWGYERDPDDAHYVNLAIAAEAQLIVSRDKDLLDLMASHSPDARDLRSRFPSLRITDPVSFLNQLSNRK